MKVLVLGGTGGTGRQIVREAVAKGHVVAALVRSKGNAHDLPSAELSEGDARDEAALARALEGCDAVISSLGTGVSPFRKVTSLSTATIALIGAMNRRRVRRLVCITGVGAGDSRGHGGLLYDRLIFPLLLRRVYEDKDRQEDAIRASSLEWVIVRPQALNDRLASGHIKAVTNLTRIHGGKIERADVASFVVDQLTTDTWLHQTPLISSQ